MFEFFKHNIVVQIVLIVVVGIAMWAGYLLAPEAMPEPDGGAIYAWVYGWLSNSRHVAAVLAFMLVIGEGLLLNVLLQRCRLTHNNSYLPMLTYVVAMSCAQGGHTVTPAVLVNLVVLLMMRRMMPKGEQPVIAEENLFVVSMLMALATMITPSAVALVVALLVFIALYKTYSLREAMLYLLGFLAPYIVWALYYFMTDKIEAAALLLWQNICDIHLVVSIDGLIQNILSGIYLLLMVVALAFNGRVRTRRVVVDNNNNTIIIALVAVAVLMSLYGSVWPIDVALFAVPMAYLASVLFLGVGRHWFWKVLFVVWLGVSIASVYLIA